MQILIADISESDRMALVQQLLRIALQQERIQQREAKLHQLEDEIARLKGLKARPPLIGS